MRAILSLKRSEKDSAAADFQLADQQVEPGTTPALPNDNAEVASVNVDDTPPDGGYCWVVVFAVALLNAFTWGIAASYGVYLAYYIDCNHFAGATPLDYAFIGGIELGSALPIAPLCTILTRELGRVAVMSAGVLMFARGFIAASFASKIWHLYLKQGLLVGLGIGCLFIPATAVVPQWFLRRRSLATGLTSCGSGFGGLAISLGTSPMIQRLSLAWSLRIIGLLGLLPNGIATALIRDRNHLVKPPQLGFAKHLLRRYDCLLLLSWAFVNLIGYMITIYSLSSYGVQIVGLTQAQAGILTAVQNLGTAIGRPAIGYISDRLGRIEVAAFLTTANGVIIFAFWVPATSYGLLIFFSLISELWFVYWMTVTPLCAEVAGLKEVPSFLSLQWIIAAIPTTFAELVALYLRRPSMGRWGYLYAQLLAGLAYLVAGALLFELLRVKRKQKRLECAG